MSAGGEAVWIDASALGDEDLLAGWRGFAEQRGNPFLTPEWFRAWIDANPGQEPAAIVWRRDGEVRGVLPLVRARRGPLRVLRFAGAEVGDWFGPACAGPDEDAMARDCGVLLRGRAPAWHQLELARLECGGPWPEALAAAHGGLLLSPSRRAQVLPFVELGDGGYEEYLRGRSRNFRSQLGRRKRRLEGRLALRLADDPRRLPDDFELFRRLHDERWRARGGSGAFPGRSWEAHLAFARSALRQGWLRLWIATIDGAPAASWYGWRIGDRYCYALSGLAPRFEPLGVGTVLLAETIEAAAAEGATLYDLMSGDEPYKRRFETGRRQAGSWALGRRASGLALAAQAAQASRRLAAALSGRRR